MTGPDTERATFEVTLEVTVPRGEPWATELGDALAEEGYDVKRVERTDVPGLESVVGEGAQEFFTASEYPDAPDPEDMTSDDLRASVEAGVAPRLLMHLAPTFPLAVEAMAYEQGQLAEVYNNALNDEDADADAANYWKGRMETHATVRGDLASLLLRHGVIDRFPLTDTEAADLANE